MMNLEWHIGWEISREKEFGFKHTGVVFGKDKNGNILILHNHKDTDIQVVTLSEFLGGEHYFQLRKPSLPMKLVFRRMEQALNIRKKYKLTDFNCQHFSSSIVDGIETSSAVNGMLTIAAIAGVAYLLKKHKIIDISSLI
ncbi:hypothetical protein LPTSP2_38790 [Leptospira ellinghausenii]|uniref:LRAT domain-containing protein n=1 Tax=Leptospira ellinghausenii TaxID=1917822 RepID=A0A2P2DIV2_9LEPT|nr:hypothetical protein [Leptospira ellinghausenii]GBF44576.1 hypothetical protein LPTSP2_38790 [Leptospira ellinghausenii]